VWRVTALVAVAVGGAVLLTSAAVAVVAGDVPALPAIAPVVVVIAAVAAFAWWWPGVRYRHWRYRLGDDALELWFGPIIRTESVIPYFRVQHVDTSAGPIERKLGLANLKVHTASAATDAVLPGLAAADAEAIRRRMLERAGAGDAV
jgi:membrane protein YdbS with pleckstrin-like domain